MCLKGHWGSVCHRRFEDVDASVACKSLNLSSESKQVHVYINVSPKRPAPGRCEDVELVNLMQNRIMNVSRSKYVTCAYIINIVVKVVQYIMASAFLFFPL